MNAVKDATDTDVRIVEETPFSYMVLLQPRHQGEKGPDLPVVVPDAVQMLVKKFPAIGSHSRRLLHGFSVRRKNPGEKV